MLLTFCIVCGAIMSVLVVGNILICFVSAVGWVLGWFGYWLRIIFRMR